MKDWILQEKILLTFSMLLLIGVISGETYRTNNISFLKENQIIPWDNAPPKSTYEALDWIVTSQKLKQMGYSNNQIKSLYKIREKELIKYKNDTLKNDTMEDDLNGLGERDESGYDKSLPFNAVIPDKAIEYTKVTRGPASIE